MAENGNRGPNDFRSRNGKKRREPPIIDASATEVPADDAAPVDPDPLNPSATEADQPIGRETSSEGEPVLFGSAMRDPQPREPAPRDVPPREPTILGGGAASADPLPWVDAAPGATGIPEASTPQTLAPAADEPAGDAATPDAAFSATSEDEPKISDGASSVPPAFVPPAARTGPGPLPGVLGVACLVLLGIIAWLVYAGPQRSGQEALAGTVADLKTRIAALETRPDPSQVQSSVAALDKRLAAADGERAALAKTVTGLTARLDMVAQQAQAAKTDADKANATLVGKPAEAGGAAAPDAARPPVPAFATLGAVAALATKVDGLDKNLASLSGDQARAAKAVADLPKPVPPDFGPVNAKVAALDMRLTDLDGKLNASDARFNSFDAKVNGVDGKVNGFDARMNRLDGRVNTIESKADDTGAQEAKLQTAVANLPKVDLGPLQTSAKALDARLATVEGQLAAPKNGARVTEARAVGSADETKATPIALVGQSIEGAIADGRPYGSDLDALKALGVEPETLAKLSPLAAGGAPTAAALKERWDTVEGDVLAALKPPEASGGSALDRFATSARNLVQVRRVGAVAPGGNDAAATVLAIDAALTSDDIPGALAAWTKLPAAGQDRSRDWAAEARSQVDAEAAARALVGRAIATLGRIKS